MCGRTACTLNPDVISKSCKYTEKDGKSVEPRWSVDKDKYLPSYNKAPQSYCPILLNKTHFKETADEAGHTDERTLAAMRWGLIPNWFKGDSLEKVNYSMNNARSDTMLEKKSYKNPLRKGQRCVVLADGFYEWKTTGKGKQPYYIYFPQESSMSSAEDEEKKNHIGDGSMRLLTMAGIFEKTFHDGKDVYSYSIITVDADESFAWLHHRMPAILTNEDEIAAWLDYENVSLEKAIGLIKPKNCLKWHPVSKFVNNSRNPGPQCREEVDLHQIQKESDSKHASESKNLMKWLTNSTNLTPQFPLSPIKSSYANKGKKRAIGAMDKWVKKMAKD